ncbi:unnamed protein product [Toxocara canis]|uniref:Zinc finger protein n=1 Tax=Toxocara canis TaxID=6265 RepID=A0A183UBE0_TOXCA|nr:unnamed protein product [Toxocara canis]
MVVLDGRIAAPTADHTASTQHTHLAKAARSVGRASHAYIEATAHSPQAPGSAEQAGSRIQKANSSPRLKLVLLLLSSDDHDTPSHRKNAHLVDSRRPSDAPPRFVCLVGMSGGTPELLIRTTPGGGGGQHTASTVEGGGGEKLRNTLPTSLIQVAASAAQLDNNCNLCAKSFPSQKLLQQHQHMFHTEKAFICEICGKAFRFRSNLAEHRSVHTALKPYVCKFCGKSSRLKGG